MDCIIYLNQMLVINDNKYVDGDKLTEYAILNPHECALKFDYKSVFDLKINKSNMNQLLNSSDGHSKVSINASTLSILTKRISIHYNHFNSHEHNIPNGLNETIKYHFDKALDNKIVYSLSELADEADVSNKTLKNYMKDSKPKSRIILLKIGFALRLSTPYLLDLFNKYDEHKTIVNEENILFDSIIQTYGVLRCSLAELYQSLKHNHKEYILDMSNAWLKRHGFSE